MLDIATEANIVEKSGSWFSYKGERIGQGRENVKQFLKDNKDIAARMEIEVRKHVGLVKELAPAQAATAGAGPVPVNGHGEKPVLAKR
jgi:recombination protein RecA